MGAASARHRSAPPVRCEHLLPAPRDPHLLGRDDSYPSLYKVAFPFQSIRVPARFGMLVMLSVAALAGCGASRLLSRLANPRARLACAALITAGLMVDGWPRYDSLPMWERPPSIDESLPASAVLFEFPVRPQPERFGENLPYMYFSMWHWRPMVNGYSGFNPREYAATLKGTRGFASCRVRIGTAHRHRCMRLCAERLCFDGQTLLT